MSDTHKIGYVVNDISGLDEKNLNNIRLRMEKALITYHFLMGSILNPGQSGAGGCRPIGYLRQSGKGTLVLAEEILVQ